MVAVRQERTKSTSDSNSSDCVLGLKFERKQAGITRYGMWNPEVSEQEEDNIRTHIIL